MYSSVPRYVWIQRLDTNISSPLSLIRKRVTPTLNGLELACDAANYQVIILVEVHYL